MRHLNIEGSYNVRDLGGYPTSDGQTTRWKVIVRSGNLDKVSEAGRQQLLDYGITSIIDLRDAYEVEKYPNVFAQSTDVRYQNLPLFGSDASTYEEWREKTKDYDLLHELYIKYLEYSRTQIGAIVSAIIHNAPGTVFHCHVGKDRTGIITALLLGAVGVPAEVIADDYTLTSAQITPLIEQWRAFAESNGHDMQMFDRDTASIEQTMLAMLAYLDERYGGVSNYLYDVGVTQSEVEQLKSLLRG